VIRTTALAAVLLALLLAATRALHAGETAHLFALYRAGDLDRLERALAAARRERPGDVDLRLLAGLLALRRGRTDEAERHLRAVLRRAPDYRDARLALARLRHWRGDPEEARALLAPLASEAAEDPEVLALFVDLALAGGAPAEARARLAEARRRGRIPASRLGWIARRIAAAERRVRAAAFRGDAPAPPARRLRGPAGGLRLLAYARRARWSDGRAPWSEGRLALLWRPDAVTAVELGGTLRRRFGTTDLLLDLALVRREADGSAWRLALGLGPGAGFSPRIGIEGELEHPFRPGEPHVPRLLARLRLSRYREGTALLGGLGLRLAPTGATGLALRADLARDAGGRLDVGGSLRLDLDLGRARLFGGLGLLLDDERGRVTERTLFAGFHLPLREGVRLFCDLDLVRRDAVRVGAGCGLALDLGRSRR